MLNFLRRLFEHRCEGCTARDYHIASLKEIIHQRDEFIMHLEMALASQDEDKNNLVRQLTGQNRTQVERDPSKTISLPRRGGIQQRIAHAEQVTNANASVISAQRRKEYEERTAALLRPEIEVRDAVQEDSTEQVQKSEREDVH